MGFLTNFGFKGINTVENNELPDIFPLSLVLDVFIKDDIIHTYSKILTDTIERTHGITDKIQPRLWDSCLQNQTSEGLVTLLSCAMAEKTDLFLVYLPSVDVLRRATMKEEAQIKKDYEKTGESTVGVYVSFKRYRLTDLLRIYSAFEYCVLGSLNKTLNLSKAIQVKINELRSSVALNDSAIAVAQAQSIAKALAKGLNVLLDSKDTIENAKPDTSSSEKAIAFLDSKRAFLLGLPISYISGLQTPGIGSTGEADMRAVERGLKQYYNSIIEPVLKSLFKIDTEFKSQDFREITTGLEVLKAFDLVSDDLISLEARLAIIARVFGLDPEKEQKALEAEAKEREKELEKNPPPAPILPGNANQNGDPNVANKQNGNLQK